jgi:hypothetical protein
MVPAYLTDSQWTRCNAYLVLWKFALPQLTNWVQDDRFLNMITFYQQRYNEELVAVFADGVEYDDDNSGTIEDDERGIVSYGRLTR